MNKDIVLFSTRNIGDKETIFQNTTRMDEPSQSLCEYLLEVNADDLDNLKIPVVKKNTPHPAFEQLRNLIVSLIKCNDLLEDNEKENLKKLCKESMPDYQKLYDIVSIVISKYKLEDYKERLIAIQKRHEEECDNSLSFSIEDFKHYLTAKAINTEKPKDKTNLTLCDRISLFKVCNNNTNNTESDSYIVYAVLPLAEADKDEGDDETHTSKWVDALVDAVLKAEGTKEEEQIHLILMIHDKDLASQSRKDLYTLYKNREVSSKNISLTLCVFQHPNSEYQHLINNSIADAKEIFDKVNNIAKKTFKIQFLKNISSLITYWTKDIDSLKQELNSMLGKEINNDSNDFDKNLKDLKDLTDSICPNNNKGIFELNERVNKLIDDSVNISYGDVK